MERRADWFRPALWLGLAFNLLAGFPAIRLLQYPTGADIGWAALNSEPLNFVFITAALAFVVGFPFALWQIRKRLKAGRSVLWEGISCLLCFSSVFSGWGILTLVVKLKDFDSF